MTAQVPHAPLEGAKALVVGIANEHSIAYGCAKAFRELGADLALTYLNDKAKPYVEPLARALEANGIRTATLHSNRSQNQRLRALKDFKSGAVRVLVATDIAARGIDVDGISHVVNYDFPMHAEDYVHRIGRTGRAQAVGDAISFVTPEDQSALRSLERFIGRGIVRKRSEGFNYMAGTAATVPVEQQQRRDISHRTHPKRAGQRPYGGDSQRRHGFRSASARSKKRRRTHF